MEINKGMYVKYIRGMINGYVPPRIAKATDCSDKDLIKIDNGQVILKNDILQASYNIIDLIEAGDYVNGYKVSFKDKDVERFVQCDYPVQEGTTNHYRFYEQAIYSIVTKEQMESMAYEVE